MANKKSAPVRGALVAFAFTLAVALVLIRFFYRERTPYAYLLFPAAILTAYVLEKAKSWAYATLSVLAFLGLIYVALQVVSPSISNAGRSIAAFLQSTTKPEEVVMSNLR
jgi:hypothetical protein